MTGIRVKQLQHADLFLLEKVVLLYYFLYYLYYEMTLQNVTLWKNMGFCCLVSFRGHSRKLARRYWRKQVKRKVHKL